MLPCSRRLPASDPAQRSGVEELRLNVNQLEAQGMRCMSKLMRACPSLSTLTLRSNDIRDDGARALCDALVLPHRLRALVLSQNNIGDEGALRMVNGSSGGLRADMTGNQISREVQEQLVACGHRV